MNSKTLDAYLHIAGGLYPSLGWIGEHLFDRLWFEKSKLPTEKEVNELLEKLATHSLLEI